MSEIEQSKQPEEQPTTEQLSREIYDWLAANGIQLRLAEFGHRTEQPETSTPLTQLQTQKTEGTAIVTVDVTNSRIKTAGN